MPSKSQRYEAAVKLNTGEIVQYHNINTGLFKFHSFVCDKFSEGQKWVYYTVRRKETKEVLETYKNSQIVENKAVKLYLNHKEGAKKTGYIISLPVFFNRAELTRDVFVGNSQVLELFPDSICIPQWLFHKICEKALKDLLNYFIERGQNISAKELQLGNFEKVEYMHESKTVDGTEPVTDYP